MIIRIIKLNSAGMITGAVDCTTFDDAAELMQLDPHDIQWAIEEHGRCDGMYEDERVIAWIPTGRDKDGNIDLTPPPMPTIQ